MKKVIALLVAMLFLVMCSACSSQENSSKPPDSVAVEPAAPAKASRFASVTVGDTVTFGSYEQDNNLENGPEPIEWIVLDVQDGKALLLSKYGLDAKPYNTEETDVTWETCSLRAWLNSDFLNNAFSGEEQKEILTTSVDNSPSQGYSEWSEYNGKDTQDKVFLLSYAEACRYLGGQIYSDEKIEPRMAPTEYAIKAGAGASNIDNTADGSAAGLWWLRSQHGSETTLCVWGNGTLGYNSVDNAYVSDRPALWVDLK